jgi:hypothetical protein
VSDVNANIGIHFDTATALSELRRLQAGLSKFNQSLTQGNIAAENAQKGLNSQLIQSINQTGKFIASQKDVHTSTAAFTSALEKNQLSLKQYFRYTAAATSLNSNVLKNFFAQEKEILQRASKDRVKTLQSQYVQLTNANGQLVKTLQVMPKHLQMTGGSYTDYATRVQMAAQRQQFLNQLLKQGSTQLLNFGKNTQWAGRQLMVGLTIPLTMLGSFAAKTFREMEEATVKFQRVYGDMTTSVAETDKAVAGIKLLANEFTKYGVAVKDTMNMAADAAAAGYAGSALTAQVTQATRLSVLGQVDQQQALQTTISLQNAFGISSDQLAQKINFLNAVENQTVLSIDDLTIAIPKAAPVVKQLGGNVEDLAFFLTAMKEGGINASEGANALKSGLASMINPTKKASDMLAGFGINIKGIVNNNAGDLKGTVVGFARALDTLAPLDRARAIEQMFGKFQFARLSTLFQNITKDGSQASRALGLAGASIEELAILAERETSKIENATGKKFQKAIEDMKVQLMPLGKAFLQAATPIVKFVGNILEKFNNLSDGTKKIITTIVGVVGGLAPVALMAFGLLANGTANVIKFFAMLRGGMAKLNGQSNVLGAGFDYMTQQQIESLAQSNALHTSHQRLVETFNVEAGAANALAAAYANAASQARALAMSSPGLFNAAPGAMGATTGLAPRKYAEGVFSVPGSGTGDKVPAMLEPGETVVSKDNTDKYGPLLKAIGNDSVPGYATGRDGIGADGSSISFGGKSYAIPNRATPQSANLALISELSKFSKDVEGVSRVLKMLEEQAKIAGDGFKKLSGETIKNILEQEGVARNRPKGTAATTYNGENYVFAHGQAPGAPIRDPQELQRLADMATSKTSGVGKHLQSSADAAKAGDPNGYARQFSNFGFMLPEKANKGQMSPTDLASKFGGKDMAITMAPMYDQYARSMGMSLEEALNNPAVAAQMHADMQIFAKRISDEVSKIPTEFVNDPEFYAAVETAQAGLKDSVSGMMKKAIADAKSTSVVGTFGGEANRGSEGQRISLAGKETALRTELGASSSAKPYRKRNPEFVKASTEISDALDKDLTRAEKQIAKTASPSKRTKKLGQDIGDGLSQGLASKAKDVSTQSDKLKNAAKVDVDNKTFYDDINTPDMRDQRQVLKSLDRRRRDGKGSISAGSSSGRIDKSSTTLTLEVEKLSKATGDSLEAQRRHQDNIVTASDLAEATAGSSEQIANAASQTADAQRTSSVLADQISKKDREILAEKERELAALRTKINSSASQSQSLDTRMTKEQALKEASGYAREDGQIFIDPGTGDPMDKKTYSKMKRGMRREKVGKFSGKAAGALGMATMVAGAVGAPPAVTGALGAASTLSSLAPMIAGLSGPQGILAAIVAVGAGLWMLNKHFDASARKQAEYVRSITASTEKMKQIGELTGKVGASEIMAKRRSAGSTNDLRARDRQGEEFGVSFVGGEVGKKMLKIFQDNISKVGAKDAAKTFGTELATYVSDGVLTTDQAKSIAYAIGVQLGDANLTVQVDAQLGNILGPNGENLTRDPLTVPLNIIQAGDNKITNALGALKKMDSTTVSGAAEATTLGTIEATNLGIIQAQADAVQLNYDNQIKKLQAEIAQTTNKEKQLKLEEDLARVTAQAASDTQSLNEKTALELDAAVARFQNNIQTGNIGMFNDLARRERAYFVGIQSTITDSYKGTDQATMAQKQIDRLAGIDNKGGKDQGFNTGKSAQNFAVRMELMLANKVISPNQSNALLDLFDGNLKQLETTLDIGMKTHGASKTTDMLMLFTNFTDKSFAQKMSFEIALEDNDSFNRLSDILGLVSSLDGKEINMEIFLKKQDFAGLKVLDDEFQAIDKDIKLLNGKEITVDTVMNYDKQYGTDVSDIDIKYLQDNFKTNEDRAKAIKEFEIISKYVNTLDFTSPEAVEMFNRETEARLLDGYRKRSDKSITWEDYKITNHVDTYAAVVKEYTGDKGKLKNDLLKGDLGYIPGVTSNNGGTPTPTPGAGKTDDPYADLLKRLKEVRLASIDAAGGIGALNKALLASKKGGIGDQYKGIKEQMLDLGKNSQFMDFITSLDPKEQKKFMRTAKAGKGGKAIDPFTGKAIKGGKVGDVVFSKNAQQVEAGLNKAITGDFIVAQKSVLKNLNEQEIVTKKLAALGMSNSEIQQVLSDEAMTTVIATGKITDKELATNIALEKQRVAREKINELINVGKAAIEEQNNNTKIPAVLEFFAKNGPGMSPQALNSLISDPKSLAGAIAAMETYGTDSEKAKEQVEQIAKGLEAVQANSKIKIALEYANSDLSGKAAKGYEAAQKIMNVRKTAYSNMSINELRKVETADTSAIGGKASRNIGEAGYQAARANGVNLSESVMAKSLAGIQKQRANLAQAISISSARTASLESQITQAQNSLSKSLEENAKKYEGFIKTEEDTINTKQDFIKKNFEDPAKKLGVESNKISNDLSVMSHAADEINKKYDAQAEALANVQHINENIIRQQQQQLGLADALSSGDIAAAAKAAQDMRAADAANYSGGVSSAMDQARNNEINNLTNSGGQNQAQLQERQYQISQELFALETDPARVAAELAIETAQAAITKYQKDQVDAAAVLQTAYDLKVKTINDALTAEKGILDDLQKQDAELALEEVSAQAVLDQIVSIDDSSGHTLDEWKDIVDKLIEAEPLADAFAISSQAAADTSEASKNSWASILTTINKIPKSIYTKHTYDEIHNITNYITNYVTTVATGASSGGKSTGGTSDSTDGSATTKKTAVSAGKWSPLAMASGGMTPRYFGRGGFNMLPIGTDTIPAMLSPGEFVVSKFAVDNFGADKLKAINSGNTDLGSVYNYNLSVNVKSDANPNDIAQTIIEQIRQVDNQRIRSNRL